MVDESGTAGKSTLLGKSLSRREAIKLGAAGTGALFVSLYVKPTMQNIGRVKASAGTPTNTGFEGCTPGFWSRSQHLQYWPAHIQPGDLWQEHFKVGNTTTLKDKTLLQLLPPPDAAPCEKQFAMHAIAALLNAATSVNYPLDEAEVKVKVKNAVESDPFSCAAALLPVKGELEGWNELSADCPVKD